MWPLLPIPGSAYPKRKKDVDGGVETWWRWRDVAEMIKDWSKILWNHADTRFSDWLGYRLTDIHFHYHFVIHRDVIIYIYGLSARISVHLHYSRSSEDLDLVPSPITYTNVPCTPVEELNSDEHNTTPLPLLL